MESHQTITNKKEREEIKQEIKDLDREIYFMGAERGQASNVLASKVRL
jgi:hypothetical protein